ncbi:HAMP domain-containing protein [Sphingomonas lacunae]|uniref:histidine kinase n=2 Tax=Sphingomonas lacunae TaxID=2698828 RepID=A0A6M4AXC8_9SPHN|nr:HAMP domain-containing protein [Sphingomonas lacunae]
MTSLPGDPGITPRHWTYWAEPLVLLLLALTGIATAFIIPNLGHQSLLSPLTVASLLVVNLLPAMALLVLLGRRIARRRAKARGGGEARLHTRLVALFSVTAAAPTMMVVIFASFLFQSGMDFWFSERSRGMFENAVSVAQNFFENEKRDVGANALAMATDLRNELARSNIESDQFYDFYVQQVVVRELSESAIIEIGPDGIPRTAALIDPDNRAAETRLPPATIRRLMRGEQLVAGETGDGVEAAVRLLPERPIFLYAARGSSLLGLESVRRARSVFADYNALFDRSRDLQFRFILALYLGSLVLVGLVIAVAIIVADRIVKPIDELVTAAQRISAGNLETRVRSPRGRPDEIAMLAGAFNQMTERLGEQTRDLLDANEQIENRRAFIEAVLSAVASGVISLDEQRRIRLVNASAARMLRREATSLVGMPLTDVAPDLDDWIDAGGHEPVMAISVDGDARTWAAKVVSDEHGQVLTFEDITQQLYDQRRAAWSDVARRVAHEIKNPLTPIQLAAERLQRRFGKTIAQDEETFRKLTSTIVRQVGDLRRMVDEFSSFARMPKPMFRAENLGDVLRQSVFLQEVAKPEISFTVDLPDQLPMLVCDRRLLAQAFTNIVKNAVEAIERSGKPNGEIITKIASSDSGNSLLVTFTDNGVGLPAERHTIVEPYVTTREGGSGLGLAIVKKIIEEHAGELAFDDRPGGGTIVTVTLSPEQLDRLGAEDGTAQSLRTKGKDA